MKPRNATTEKKLLQLKCDNKSFGKGDILIEKDRVSIWPESEKSDQWISMSRKEFNVMIDWYNKKQ